MKAVSVILPTYNERETIEPLIRDILGRSDPASEIIVVDDDSPDGTWEIVSRLAAENPRVRLIRRRETRGLTLSLREGIEAARGEFVIWMDADFSHPPSLLPALIDQTDAADIVVASRYIAGGSDGRRSFVRKGVSTLLNRTGRLVLKTRVHDLSSGYLRVNKQVFSRVPLRGEYGDYCIDFLVRAEKSGYTIREIPFTNIERERGTSKTTHNPLIFLRYAFIYIHTLFRLKREVPD
jgi:dolichol-phosphate mannosyltransferase